MKNSKTGVFVGMSSDDYAQAHRHSGQLERIDAYSIMGTTFSTAVGRLSYTLGLQGPCMALDTACSSSLVALHLACQSLRAGESNLALAGGVNLILSPQLHICFSKLQAISPEGKCKTFDASADGYVRGEGCGMVVLKRLQDALKDGDRILAVVKGSAINQDGKTNGLAAPNGNAQQAVICQALADAGLQPARVDYVEAHGTGTVLGDPIEVEALGAVFGPGRHEPLRLGAVKTNIGHLEPAAGIAGFIKIILSLLHEELPPNLHFQRPNPYINWQSLPLQVVSERSAWKRSDRARVAGVSAFGFSGTNAHVIVEEAPPPPPQATTQERSSYLLSVSARDEHALRTLAADYLTILSEEATRPTAIGDVCYSASVGRRHWSQRVAIEGHDKADIQRKLASFLQGREERGLTAGSCEEGKSPDLAFLFTGQGVSVPWHGRGLRTKSGGLQDAIDRCDALLQPLLNTSLVELLFAKEAETLNQTVYAQPALFALEYALSELWASWGIRPSVVMGHSVGEYVAAYVAGVFSLEEGIRLIAKRGQLMQALPRGGGMATVFAAPDLVAAALAPHAGRVGIAAANGPQHIVMSGEQGALQAVCSTLESEGIRTTALAVSHAFHSHLMEPMLAAFAQEARQVAFSPPHQTRVESDRATSARRSRLPSTGSTIFASLLPLPPV
jgi:acyl transferase domain-containing protein